MAQRLKVFLNYYFNGHSQNIFHEKVSPDFSEKEGFSIRDIMELFLQRGIDDYERLHGPVKPKRKKGVDSILK